MTKYNIVSPTLPSSVSSSISSFVPENISTIDVNVRSTTPNVYRDINQSKAAPKNIINKL